MTQYTHLNCGGQIRVCPVNELEFCDKCDKFVLSECEVMTQVAEPEPEDFELTDCADPRCGICRFVPGYGANMDYAGHKDRLAKVGSKFLNWIDSASNR